MIHTAINSELIPYASCIVGKLMRKIAITSSVVTCFRGPLTLTMDESPDNEPHDSFSLSTALKLYHHGCK